MASKKRRAPAHKKSRLTNRRQSRPSPNTEPAEALHGMPADSRIADARAAVASHRYADAVRLYEQVYARHSKHAALMLELAHAHGRRYDIDRARPLLLRVSALYPQVPEIQRQIAGLYAQFQDYPAARACYEIAAAKADRPEQAVSDLVALARVYERLNLLDEAMLAVQRVLGAVPNHPYAQLTRSKLLRRLGDTEGARTGFEALTNRGDISIGVLASAWYGIAGLRDQEGDYRAAMSALQIAKQTYADTCATHRQHASQIQAGNTVMLNELTHEHFLRWEEQAPRLGSTENVAWLVGHPRSGTTLIEQVADSHSGLVSADETGAMSGSIYPRLLAIAEQAVSRPGVAPSIPSMLDHLGVDAIRSARSDYLRQTQGAINSKTASRVLLDKNPEVTLLLPVICRLFPEAKVIVALRDPRDVVLSCFFQDLVPNAVSVSYMTLEDAAKKYAHTIGGWLKLREMMCCSWTQVRYEDTVDNLEDQARRVLDFLGLTWDAGVLDYHKRANKKHVHSPTYEAVTKPVYRSSIGRWKNYQPYMGEAIKILQPMIESLGYE